MTTRTDAYDVIRHDAIGGTASLTPVTSDAPIDQDAIATGSPPW